jgi:hypothetical protein
MLTTCKSCAHYSILRQIKYIKSNFKEIVPIESGFIINAQRKQDGLRINLLFHQRDQGVQIIGIWPPQQADFFKENKNLLEMLITQFVKNPELFERVNIFISVELEEKITQEFL